jgi:hypothetical protein
MKNRHDLDQEVTIYVIVAGRSRTSFATAEAADAYCLTLRRAGVMAWVEKR